MSDDATELRERKSGGVGSPDSDAGVAVDVEYDASEAGSFRRAALKNYRIFDRHGTHSLNLSQVYALLTTSMPRGQQVGAVLLGDAAEYVDSAQTGVYSEQKFEKLLDRIEHLRAADAVTSRASTAGTRFIYAWVVFAFFPVFMPLAVPIGDTARRSPWLQWARVIFRHYLRELMLPLVWRRRFAENLFFFALAYLLVTVAYSFGIFALAVYIWLETRKLGGGNVSFLEPAIPVALGVLGTFIMAATLALGDADHLEGVARLESGGPLSSMQLELQLPAGMPSKSSSSSSLVSADGAGRARRPATALEYLGEVLGDTPKGRRTKNRWERFGAALALVLALAFASGPFILRALLDKPITGQCSGGAPPPCLDRREYFMAVAVGSFVLGFVTVWWLITRMLQAFFVLTERAKNFSYLGAALDDTDGEAVDEEGRPPRLAMSRPGNVIAWSKMREFVISFRRDDVRRLEVVLAAVFFLLLVLIPIVLYQRIEGFSSEIDQDYVIFVGGAFVALVGCYLVNPLLTLGLWINHSQAFWANFFTRESWRVRLLAECAQAEEAAAYHGKAANLCRGLLEYMRGCDTTLRFLGVAVTSTLVYSVATPVAAALYGWISQFL